MLNGIRRTTLVVLITIGCLSSPSGARFARGGETWEPARLMPYNCSSLVVDPVRDRLVLFGGLNGDAATHDVWVKPLSGGAPWSRLDIAGPHPPESADHAAIYDPVGDRMVVFGGSTPGTLHSEAWALSLSGVPYWARLVTLDGGAPDVRSGARAIYDPVGRRMIVFGGYASVRDSLMNDVWALSLPGPSTSGPTTWTQLFPEGTPPSRRTETTAIYDPVQRRMVIFGGYDAALPYAAPALNDVWTLSLAGRPTWTRQSPGGEAVPELYAAAAAYDATHNRMLVFGGFSNKSYLHPEQSTWALQLGDTPSWSEIRPADAAPTPRASARAVYDAKRDQMVVFGGATSDTWSLSFENGTRWSELEPGPGEPATGRGLHAAVYDATHRRVLVFAGFSKTHLYHEPDIRLDDLWSLTFEPRPQWQKVFTEASPGELRGHSMVLDSPNDRLIVFGGFAENPDQDCFCPYEIETSDVWQRTLDGGTKWTRLAVADSAPAPRQLHSAVYDPVRHRMIVFGGINTWGDRQGEYGDLWALSLDAEPRWTRLQATGVGPGPRYGHAAVYDPVGDRMLVFGGTSQGVHDDTWQLTLAGTPAWSELPSSVRPRARSLATLVYDPRRERLVMFGGEAPDEDGDGGDLGDTWVLPLAEGAGWSPASVAGESPAPRGSAAGVYDSDLDRIVVLEGRVSDYNRAYDGLRDTWMLSSDARVPTHVAFVHADAGPLRVVLTWQASGDLGFAPSVERRLDSGPWVALAFAHPDGAGLLRFEDATAQPLQRYAYRLSWSNGAAAATTPGVEVTVPALRFALMGAVPNPSTDGLAVKFSLPDAAATSVQVMDIAGRRLIAREVGTLGPGDHVLRLAGAGEMKSGVYWIRLTRGYASLVRRVYLIQ